MGGVFLKHLRNFLWIAAVILLSAWFASVLFDRIVLSEDVIRLHVVADSDSEDDQMLKLKVRDAVTAYLQQNMGDITDSSEALCYLQENLDSIELVAQQVVEEEGFADNVAVTLQQETFPIRKYDTFSLPSGVYESLRITIGDGAGQNWWCVVFPALCAGATTEEFSDTAAGAGFSSGLNGALKQQKGYEIRFFVLDLFGKIQNFFAGM